MYYVRIARVNVYLPDDLALRVKEADLNVSAVTRDALERELAGRATNAWLDRIRRLPPTGITHEEVMAAIDAGRDEYDPQ